MLAGLAGGCTLIDQNTFNPHAGDRPVIAAAPVPVPPPAGPPALLTIALGATGYGEAVKQAASQARARRAGVMFDVVEYQPTDAAADAVGAAAAGVGRAIVAAGVPAGQVRLDVRPDASARAGEVRVFVR